MPVEALQRKARDSEHSVIELGLFPCPYRAALAICSDLDETPDAETYFELMRFLNTTEETTMGRGVGLEIGNSIYFDMPPGHFSYWNADERNRARVRTLIRSGHIDCLHSYGDLATTRSHAGRALDELARHDCRLSVWVDHAVAPTNFGADIMRGHGDELEHPAYHADLTIAHGIRYVWRGRVTSVIGQDRRISLGGIGDWRRPVASIGTVAKEATKQMLARCGSPKYGLHAPNRTMRRVRLRDNRCDVYEFLRCNPHFAGVSSCDTGSGISQVLSRRFLDRLVERQGTCILYTHLGKLGGARRFSDAVVASFRLLAEYFNSDRILVATTARLLQQLTETPHALLSSVPQDDGGVTGGTTWKRLEFPQL